ncbi:MAG: glycosyltransferase [Candidatus Neomarinimicrobiota bacterium]
MNLFIVPSWYPSRLHPESGSFFRDRAEILQADGQRVTVVAAVTHSTRDLFRFYRVKIARGTTAPQFSVPTISSETLNPFPCQPRNFFRFYRRQVLRLWERAVRSQGRPEVVLINSSLWAGAGLAGTLAAAHIPFVVSEHLKEFLLPDGFTPFQQRMIRETYRQTTRIIATSPALKDGITRLFPDLAERITVIPNPVDTEFFRPGPVKRIPENSFTFIAIALLRPEKRIDLLLQALALLENSTVTTRLIVAGSGPEQVRLQDMSRRLGLAERVEFVGYQQPAEIRTLLQRSQALVLPSTVETFGVALIEAQACGLPVIATRCGGPEAIVLPETGLLVDCDNIAALAAGMDKMIAEYTRFRPELIRASAHQRYGAQAYSDTYRRLLTEISGNK